VQGAPKKRRIKTSTKGMRGGGRGRWHRVGRKVNGECNVLRDGRVAPKEPSPGEMDLVVHENWGKEGLGLISDRRRRGT